MRERGTSALGLLRRLPGTPRERILAGLLIVTVLVVSHHSPVFLTTRNLVTVANDRVHIGFLAIGMTFVILIAGIDLSVGSMVALAGLAFGIALDRYDLPLGTAIAGALATGLAAGAVNGALVAGARVPALIVTLATLSVYRGLAAGLGGESALGGFGEGFTALGRAAWLDVPLPAWALAAAFAGTGVYLARTAGGRAIYAMGANEAAARLAGVPVRSMRFRIYALSGLLSGLAALTYAALNGTFKSDVGKGYELDAITVVVLGGTSVAGGEGTMLGTALGLALLAVGLNGMDLAQIPRERQSVVVALVLLFSLWLDSYVRARRGRV